MAKSRFLRDENNKLVHDENGNRILLNVATPEAIPEATPEAIPEATPEATPEGVKKERKKREKKKSILDDEGGQDAEVIQVPETKKTAVFFVSGAMLLFMVDSVLPFLMVLLMRGVFKKKNVTTEKLKLDIEQKKDLQELADITAKELSFNMNPIALFSLMLMVTYMQNYQLNCVLDD